MSRCDPCRQDHHAECAHTLEQPCDCLICIAGLIGATVLGERVWTRRDMRDRLTPPQEEE